MVMSLTSRDLAKILPPSSPDTEFAFVINQAASCSSPGPLWRAGSISAVPSHAQERPRPQVGVAEEAMSISVDIEEAPPGRGGGQHKCANEKVGKENEAKEEAK